jgi:hypothetical protein
MAMRAMSIRRLLHRQQPTGTLDIRLKNSEGAKHDDLGR